MAFLPPSFLGFSHALLTVCRFRRKRVYHRVRKGREPMARTTERRRRAVKTLGIRDIIGPIMIGPSSSHTAGALRIALMTRNLLAAEPVAVEFRLFCESSLCE